METKAKRDGGREETSLRALRRETVKVGLQKVGVVCIEVTQRVVGSRKPSIGSTRRSEQIGSTRHGF